MLAPAPSPRLPQRIDFTRLIDEACQELNHYRNSPDYVQDYGMTVEMLDQYVDGQTTEDDRQYIQGLLCRCPWAMRYVTTKVKARRESED